MIWTGVLRQWRAILVGWLATWLSFAVLVWWLASLALGINHPHRSVPFGPFARDFLIAGAVIAVTLVLCARGFERLALYLHGFRQPTRAEDEIMGGLGEVVAERMEIPHLPELRVLDSPVPAAWMFQRTLAISSQLTDLNDEAVAGILAHELAHHRAGDAIALRLAWAPVVGADGVVIGQGQRLTKQGVEILGAGAAGCASALGRILSVLAWLEMRLIALPLMRMGAREAEYAADAAAHEAGFGHGLELALQHLAVFELSPMQWHAVLAARHPPIQPRIDRLRAPSEPHHVEGATIAGWTLRSFLGGGGAGRSSVLDRQARTAPAGEGLALPLLRGRLLPCPPSVQCLCRRL